MVMEDKFIDSSPSLSKYKHTMKSCIKLYYPRINESDLDKAINYSINKRFHNSDKVRIVNSYKRYRGENDEWVYPCQNVTLQKLTDYILSKRPIVTAYGTMFMHHGEVPNPLFDVVQSFLDNRTKYKKMMFSYPKGSFEFEKYNLFQLLAKIDANGIYGTLGLYSSLLYNSNVASSITAQGREAVSSMTLHFEMMLANNVKFGSLNEMIQFIDHICNEERERKFSDRIVINHNVTNEECFAKLILDSGYRWIPNEEELDVIWKIVCNLNQEDRNRVYYKNNLYEFASNEYVFNLVETILTKLERPIMTPNDIPEEVKDDVNLFYELIKEYVYYKYMVIDRIARCDNMIKAVTMVSDTDSTIVSYDAWYRFVANKISGKKLTIANDIDILEEEQPVLSEKEYIYDFNAEEIMERERINHPEIRKASENVKHSIINLLSFCLGNTVNDYMMQMCRNNNSLMEEYHTDCRIYAKTEFDFSRLLMTGNKKNYASFITVQEGNLVPEDKGLDIKGIQILTKSVTPKSTKKALKKILLEDILKADKIDQVKIINDIAVFEKQIISSVQNGNKEYFKPATVKSMSNYEDPLRIQGVKSSLAWNMIKADDYPAINLDERNGVNIAKVNINRSTIEKIRETYPDVYANMVKALDDDIFKTYSAQPNPKTGEKKLLKNEIGAVAIPLDITLPKWLEPFIDYDTIIADNINGFPFESVGIKRLARTDIGFTNIVEL